MESIAPLVKKQDLESSFSLSTAQPVQLKASHHQPHVRASERACCPLQSAYPMFFLPSPMPVSLVGMVKVGRLLFLLGEGRASIQRYEMDGSVLLWNKTTNIISGWGEMHENSNNMTLN